MNTGLKKELTKNPLITVITVVFNGKEFLEQTILSVIRQTYTLIEYIIIDGGSTDGTIDIIKKYENKITYWLSEPDCGVYDAMNKAIDKVSGDWIYFIGAGDILLNVLDQAAPMFDNSHCLYYGDVNWADKSLIYDGYFSSFKLAVKNISHQSIFYPSAALKKYKFNTAYRTLADYHLNILIYGDDEFKFKYIGLLICVYKGGGFSALNHVDLDFFRDRMKIIRSNFSYPVFWYAYLRTKTAKLLKLQNFDTTNER